MGAFNKEVGPMEAFINTMGLINNTAQLSYWYFRALDSNLLKPQSDNGSMSQADYIKINYIDSTIQPLCTYTLRGVEGQFNKGDAFWSICQQGRWHSPSNRLLVITENREKTGQNTEKHVVMTENAQQDSFRMKWPGLDRSKEYRNWLNMALTFNEVTFKQTHLDIEKYNTKAWVL